MGRSIMVILGLAFPLGIAQASGAPATNAPDPEYGKKLATDLCSNCHLVGTGDQQRANADIPSFHEIANKEGQTAGSITAHIVVPKHPMPSIPLTQGELADLAAYILTLRESR
jgi:mono/diheme cytochrome c family protein